MSLALIGQTAAYEFRWRRWALLRDAISAHLEAGVTGSRFPRFMQIGDALGQSDPVRIVARELAQEIADIQRALGDQPIEAMVLGPPTAAALYPGLRLEAPRPLTKAELLQIAPVGDETTLAAYFSSMLDSITNVCASPAADGTVEVLDG